MKTRTCLPPLPGGSCLTRPTHIAPATAAIHPDALIRLSQILGTNGNPPLIACGRTAFYSWIKAGKLPRPRKVGRASFWRAGDILKALEDLQ